MHDDLRKMIPASNGFGKSAEDGSEEIGSTNDGTNFSKVGQEFEIEYVGMDESAIGSGRVRHLCLTNHFQHIAEFKHVFEHFTTPIAEKKSKEESENVKEDGKDAFTKATDN